MRDFQSQLEDEIEQRGLKQKPVEEGKPEKKKKQKKVKKPKRKKNKKPAKPPIIPFSFKSFLIAMGLGFIVFTGMFVWLALNADKTAEKFVANLPTKTAIVNREVNPLITTEDVQPVLRMDPVKEDGPTNENISNPVPVPTNGDMVAAPVPGLYQSTDYGPLPIKNKETGDTPFNVYKKPASLDPSKPSMAFIITDMGINSDKTQKLIEELPENITLSFSPYAWNVNSFMMAARQDNHETWLTLPLQTKNYPLQDPGPLAILSSANIKQNQSRINTVMGKAVGYAGFISEKDHFFQRENVRTNPVFLDIFDRGLGIIDSNDKSINFVGQLAERKGYPHAQNNFWLDEDLSPLALNQKLRQALEHSRNTGKAIVMLHPYPTSIKTLQKFLNSMAAKEFNIVPASALVTAE